jgi:flagellar hook-length control protein FliK
VIPRFNAPSENFDDSASNVTPSDLQPKVEVLPNAQIELPQFGIETTFLSSTRPYESVKDTDAVTQEIMNALSRGVAASAPTKSPSRVDDGLQPGVSSDELSAITNLAPFGAEKISSVSSLGNSLSNPSEELLQQAGRPQSTGLGNSQLELTNEFWEQQTGFDADRGAKQTASRDSDQALNHPATATLSGADGTRLSSSGAVTFTLPDLTTAVTSEMRQPLSYQVSRAVMEHLERRTTAESDTMTVQLDPPDLGEMVIELSKSKEGLSVRVTAREAVTMDMLLARGSEIESQLRGEKMDLRSLEFLSPDMMGGKAFQGHTSQDSTSKFDQLVGTQRRNSHNGTATPIASGATTRTGDSQHVLNFRA